MKKVIYAILVFLLLSFTGLKADEGMWLLPLLEQLNLADMKELGSALSADEIYNINHSSLKDAVVIFGEGCTGEIVSDDGLLFTNHHCGFGQIQYHSTLEHDFLQDGFWAMSRNQELPNPGLEVRFLMRIEDVTNCITQEIPAGMAEKDRHNKVRELINQIENEASDSNKYEASVKPYFAGNKYYLCVYQVYKDVRLVGAPPSSIGKFGYDSDNWEWPRHSGDFSIFRIYTAPNGMPAEYAAENIPLKPKYYLPVSLKGITKGDFTMILGYPGETDRYLTSDGIKEILEVTNANRIKIRTARQEILMADMQSDPEIKIQYASKYAISSNYWKYSIGQNIGIKKLQIIEKKQKEEAEFQTWVQADTSRFSIFGNVLGDIREAIDEKKPVEHDLQYVEEALFEACEVINFASEFNYLNLLLQRTDTCQKALNDEIISLTKLADTFYKDYNAQTDRKVVKAMLKLYRDNTPAEQHPQFFQLIDEKYKGNIDKFVDKMFDKSIFCQKEKLLAFLQKPSSKVISNDIGFRVAKSTLMSFYDDYYQYDKLEDKIDELQSLYIKGIMEMNPDKKYYPDANFTIRMSYGTVEDYSPRDAVKYNYFTTLKGVLEKGDSANYEFKLPEKLKYLYNTVDFGPYGEKDVMPVCFITNNDITGGNSGSPVLNTNGELVGLAFDGNWEAMSSDIAYEPELQRCICVDIRYVLFVIDKFAGAHNIIDELKIIN